MITHFDSFYGGHIEMDDLGFTGTPVEARRPSNEQLVTVFQEVREFAELMDRTGFDTLWLGEHHFQREGYGGTTNVPMWAVYLAQLTERLKFGSFFNTVPAWHPLRLAEDFATADILTNGRFRFGIGRGYIFREVETLGAPLIDNEANRELFEEQVEIILKAWNEESFSHHGNHYDLPPRVPIRLGVLEEITLVPRPLHLPVEVWQPITSASRRGLDFMAERGVRGVIVGGTAPGGRAETLAAEYRDALERAGRHTELGENIALGFQFHMADTQEKALREATPYHEEQLKALAPLGRMPGLTAEQIRATADPARAPLAGLPTIESLVEQGSWICGPPEHVAERIADIQDRFPGLERVFVQAGGLGIPPRVMREDLAWFAAEVMPAFRPKATAAGTS